MRRVLALGASLCVLSAADDVQAATFTSDMWVYEVTFSSNAVTPTYQYAWSDSAPLEEAVPNGCSSSPNDDGTKRIDCGDQGIDLLATMDEPLKATYLTRVQTIGFNASGVVCDGPVIAGCPGDGGGTEPFEYSYEGSYWNVVLDAALGQLSFCGNMYLFSDACYDLSPTGGTAWAGVTAGTLTGTWDAVTGGRWMAGGDPYFSYTGLARLVSSPTPELTAFATLSAGPQIVVTPLPAPILMLGSGLAAMAGFAVRDRRRRRSAA
jgi:hypothetical protein